MIYKYVYKIVAALAALSVFPIALFTPMFHIMGNIALGDTYVYHEMSLYDLYIDFLRGDSALSFKEIELTDPVRATMPYLITAGVFFALALLLALAVAATAFACRGRMPVLILSLMGVLCMIAVFHFFKRFALPYVDGTIALSDLGLLGDGLINRILGATIQLKRLRLSTAASLSLGAYIAVFLWTAAYMLVDLGDKPESAAKKSVSRAR